MKLEISITERIDKLSILEIKLNNTSDPFKLDEIQKEIDIFQEVKIYKTQFAFFYKLLYFVNDKILSLNDKIKSIDLLNNYNQYLLLSNEIYNYNQKRLKIKNFFNKLLHLTIEEEKGHALTICLLNIYNENTLFSKLSEIFYLSISYDILIIDSIYKDIISKILIIPSIQYEESSSIENNFINKAYMINLSEFSISNDLKNTFSLEPIKYVCGGLLGDFIHSLSVINEKYRETGRKGILYISNNYGGDNFRFGIEKTFETTFEIIKSQPYIFSYSIYNEKDCCGFDINLNNWRNSEYLYKENFWVIYSSSYNISWGKNQWITLPDTFQKDANWENKIIINTTSYRFPAYINFQELYEKYNDNLIFISMEKISYDNFIENTGLKEIKFYNLESFSEICLILYSCKLFIGSLSLPLSIAFAMHIPCVVARYQYYQHVSDNTHFENLNKLLPFTLTIN